MGGKDSAQCAGAQGSCFGVGVLGCLGSCFPSPGNMVGREETGGGPSLRLYCAWMEEGWKQTTTNLSMTGQASAFCLGASGVSVSRCKGWLRVEAIRWERQQDPSYIPLFPLLLGAAADRSSLRLQ